MQIAQSCWMQAELANSESKGKHGRQKTALIIRESLQVQFPWRRRRRNPKSLNSPDCVCVCGAAHCVGSVMKANKFAFELIKTN